MEMRYAYQYERYCDEMAFLNKWKVMNTSSELSGRRVYGISMCGGFNILERRAPVLEHLPFDQSVCTALTFTSAKCHREKPWLAV